ncbi:MAG TPA: phosphopantetheine-binding protein [Thermoanaerobaculia bacterium]
MELTPETEPSAAPRNDLERSLARIWCEVLGHEKVGIHDNFFALGGRSLHMIQLRDRLLADLGHDVRIADLFKYPTIASLAQSWSPVDLSEKADLGQIEKQAQKQREALLRQKRIARRGDEIRER